MVTKIKPLSKLKGCMVEPKTEFCLKDAVSRSKFKGFEPLPLVGDFGAGGQIVYSYSGKYDPGYENKFYKKPKPVTKRCRKI